MCGMKYLAFSMVLALGVSPVAGKVADDDLRVTPVVRAYRKARPAVVNISSEKISRVRFGLFGRSVFDDIFPSPRVRQKSLGSGVLINPAGYIITNAHVVRQADKITVALSDGSKYAARVISSDPEYDLAVVKIDPPAGTELSYLPLGRSDDLMVGETVIAIGNAMGYANSLTTGVISATNRELSFGGKLAITGLIQTDAPINPGNSGGPLLNINGELIGINTAIRADAQNIGFAIPVDRLAVELANLLDFERLNRVVFGASVEQRHGAGGDELVVSGVRTGTPAEGKLREGDRIVALNGKAIRQITDYACRALSIAPGDVVSVLVRRDGSERTVLVTVQAKPRPDGKALAHTLFGLKLRAVTLQLARDLRLPVRNGLLVVAVEAGSSAQRLGIEPMDVLFQAGKLYVTDVESLGMALEDVAGGDRVLLGIVRGNYRVLVTIVAANKSEE